MTSIQMKKSPFTRQVIVATALTLPLLASAQEVTEIQVNGILDTSEIVIDEKMQSYPGTGQLLKSMPGANLNSNGMLTGIAQYRGMFGDRVNVAINGMKVSSGGPNAMDAPLHYAPLAMLEAITLHRGITPVSIGMESIGGSMDAKTMTGEFNGPNFELRSKVYLGGQSANGGQVANTFLTLANDTHLFRMNLLNEQAGDADFPNGTITPSAYDRERVDVGYSYRSGNHEFSLDLARNNTGDTGTPALPMDINSIDSDIARLNYKFNGINRRISLQLTSNDISHTMTNFHMRRPPQGNAMMPGAMRYRHTQADSQNGGFALKVEQDVANGLWRLGVDGHQTDHAALITNPNAGAFYVENFDDVAKSLVGVFLERDMTVGMDSRLEFGARVNTIDMDAGIVSANMNPMGLTMGMPVMMNNMAGMIATGFNGADRSFDDLNVDWFAKYSYHLAQETVLYAGLARKSRSPSYQEMYLWLPLEATGGLADGKTYTGNLALDSEVAHEVELGLDWQGDRLFVSPRVFYKSVDDFIQGTPSGNAQVNMFANMMANMGMGAPDPLQFNNVEASLYGADVEANYRLASNWMLRAVASYVRGERRDIDDNLYRIAPPNVNVAVDYLHNNWTLTMEAVAYARQDKVSVTNIEKETAGYSLVNVSARVNVGNTLLLGLGVDNLFDREYQDHLGGYNRAYNEDIAMRGRLPGLGRNLYARLIWEF